VQHWLYQQPIQQSGIGEVSAVRLVEQVTEDDAARTFICRRADEFRAPDPKEKAIPLHAAHHDQINSALTQFKASVVAEALQADPYCGDVFVFRSKRADRLKVLVFDGTGLVLATKWLEEGVFTFPPVQDGAILLTTEQLSVLMAGLDWSQVVPRPVKRPTKAC